MILSTEEVKVGKYQHFKGAIYEVLGIAQHTETHEELIVYRALSEQQSLWTRPKKMFFQTVLLKGHKVPRFRYIE